MYNRYISPDTVFVPVPQEEPESGSQAAAPSPEVSPPPSSSPQNVRPPGGPGDVLGGITREISSVLGGLFKHFSLENLDTGDILLILIILFLFLEKDDNLDLVIALGLMLLLSLGESDQEDQPSG